MKKIMLVLIAGAASLAMLPVALGESFSFSFTGVGNTMSVTGVFDATEIGNTGVYNILSITNGLFTDTNNGLDIVNAPVSLITDGSGVPTVLSTVNGSGPGYTSPDGSEVYDNLLYNPGTPYVLDYWGGFLFSADGDEIDIAQTLNAYGGWVSVLNSSNNFVDTGSNFDAGEPLDVQITQLPEPTSLLLFLTGLLGVAVAARRKASLA